MSTEGSLECLVCTLCTTLQSTQQRLHFLVAKNAVLAQQDPDVVLDAESVPKTRDEFVGGGDERSG